jgi:5-methyltetrahydropteroyltriglutamate--homocysteine methyltransferase
MIVAVHMCRGNMNAFWGAEGGYGLMADAAFQMSNVDAFLLEYDTDRAGDFSPLRKVPKGKQVLIGVISTKDPKLENRDEIKRRIDDASKHIGIDQLGICPQCGFSTNVFGTEFTVDDQKRKLEMMVGVAKEIWATP